MKAFAFSLLCLLLFTASHATHLRAGEISVERTRCDQLTFQITITIYLNTGSTVTPGGRNSLLQFGDGTFVAVPTLAIQVIDEALKIGKAQFTITHTYSGLGSFIISYREQNRNVEVINFANTPIAFYVESMIEVNADCNSLPKLTVPPVDRACQGISFVHNPGVVDADHDSVSYEMITPTAGNGPVPGYVAPNDIKFYTGAGMDYDRANENKDGRPTLGINALTGNLVWDAPGIVGQYGIAIKITEWKYNAASATWNKTGYVVRDMQIIVEDCTNKKPVIMQIADRCAIAGKEIRFEIAARDPNNQNVTMEVFAETLNPSPIYQGERILQSTINPTNPAKIVFSWTPSCEQIRKETYRFVVKVTNRPASGIPLAAFASFSIRVSGPELVIDKVVVNPVAGSATLNWKPYLCTNLAAVQVWRRITRLNIDSEECDQGMPANTGFKLLGLSQPGTSTFVDPSVAVGVQYCYRLVPLIGEKRLEARLSRDTCLIPQPVKAPAITKVSVASTQIENGNIRVEWTSPFELDATQYPQPYRYRVLRSVKNENNFQAVSDIVGQTNFTDEHANSKERSYEYMIELYVPALSVLPLDTSSSASTVWLEFAAREKEIDLKWTSSTPWSNTAQDAPYHRIYRSETGVSGEYKLIDSVNVLNSDFHYVDKKDLKPDQHYYYKIMTRGSYGNPQIPSPITNLSQIAGGETLDLRPPCPPELRIAKPDCGTFPCREDAYYNALNWDTDVGCAPDVTGYRIMVEQPDKKVVTVADVTGSEFRHNNLNTLELKYFIVAFDDAGNVSDTTSVIGVNCPSFTLPNVFTPTEIDLKNDVFTFFSVENNEMICSRFVKTIAFFVFNKWGEEIFRNHTAALQANPLWDGTSTSGKEMPGGEYFYLAKVEFATRDEGQRYQTYKGWIHLIR